MRKPYIAPNCDYMTFTVDSAIASAPCSYNGNVLGATFKQDNDCSVTIGGLKIFAVQTTCDSVDVMGYCYYNMEKSIFGS